MFNIALKKIKRTPTILSLDGNPLISGIRYNGANQLTGWTWSDGSTYTKTYDINGRLKTFPLGDQTRTLKYDKLGNITGWNDQPTAGSAGQDTASESKAFTYDLLSRLTGYSKTQGNQIEESQHFSYDANGNRLKLIENKDSNEAIQTIYSILENANRLIKVADTDYQYDANGNIINDGEHSYTYDARNRLASIDNGTTASYLYNASNMRVKKTTVNETTNYGWDNDRIFAEYDASGNPIQETVYFGNMPVALLKDGNIYRIFADQIDTPRVITDNANNTLWAWDSKPFGETKPNEDVDGDNTKLSYNLRFPGQYYDTETGKHYNFNRDYDPVTGRYVQSDPIGLDGGHNLYAYSDLDPIVMFDPFGKDAIYIEYNGYQVDTGVDDWNGNRIKLPFGHGAVISINENNGSTRYYEYGRYDPKNFGIVIRRSIPNVTMSNGVPTNSSLDKLFGFVSKRFGQNTSISFTYYSDSSANKVNNYAERIKNNPDRKPYSLWSNNCFTFAKASAKAGYNHWYSGLYQTDGFWAPGNVVWY